MIDNRTSSHRPSRRPSGLLVVATLLVALAATACGSGTPTDAAPDGRLPQLRTASHHRVLFDTSRPTIGNLDPDLLAALEKAARDAQDDGVGLLVTSGWRSRAHQERLFAEAVRTYGSEEEARRYVATPDTSRHVTGDAVDIGPTEADSWLIQYEADYGLCQVFANEIWHFELATTPGGSCPDLLRDGSGLR